MDSLICDGTDGKDCKNLAVYELQEMVGWGWNPYCEPCLRQQLNCDQDRPTEKIIDDYGGNIIRIN